MGILRRLEKAIESKIEGGDCSRDMHVLEASRLMQRLLMDNTFKLGGRNILPNLLIVPFDDDSRVSEKYGLELVRLVGDSLSGSVFEVLAPFCSRIVKRSRAFPEPEVAWADVLGKIALGFIEGVEGPAKGDRWSIPVGNTIIGRGADAPVCVAGDLGMSRRHLAVSVIKGGRIALQDLNSSNGTMVGSKTIPPGRKVAIASGTKVKVGSSTLVFYALPGQYERWAPQR